MYTTAGGALDVVRMGKVDIAFPNRSVWTLWQVRHVPYLKKNIIFVGHLNDGCPAAAFFGGEWKVKKGLLILAHGKKTNYVFDIRVQ